MARIFSVKYDEKGHLVFPPLPLTSDIDIDVDNRVSSTIGHFHQMVLSGPDMENLAKQVKRLMAILNRRAVEQGGEWSFVKWREFINAEGQPSVEVIYVIEEKGRAPRRHRFTPSPFDEKPAGVPRTPQRSRFTRRRKVA